ncbi:hypothetical protein D6783_02175 [Candidatus Woesearchaeota archaeon]|nr:MAG: hypothetical protein D6783_02175 [Candidatus Woesearchaeota archaeon]
MAKQGGLKVAVDTPLAEITLRKYEKPGLARQRELVRKICLSLGLLQPGDSRDVMVDVLHVMLDAKEELTSAQIEKRVIEYRKKAKLPLLGIAPSNIRRQLLRLRDLFLVEKVRSTYRVKENAPLLQIFEEHIEKYFLAAILNRIKEFLSLADKMFPRKAE